MRKFTLLVTAAVLAAFASKAQTVSSFESLTLGTDTAYVNYTNSGNDVGFNNGLAHFPCVYDTSFGGYWSYGFAYSNKTDSVTSGLANQYSAKTAGGYNGSAQYAVAYAFGEHTYVKLTGAAAGRPVVGFYVTNNTYAYNSMRDGDAFGKKFGDTTGTGLTTGQGTAPDWFKLKVHGYNAGVMVPDSVQFYLADFRFANSASDYIVNTWQWVNLLPLGHVDSLTFSLSSSDNSFGYMNTPSYFCIDNFSTHESLVNVAAVQPVAAKVYPVPAADVLNIDLTDDNTQTISIVDMKGSVVYTQNVSSKHIEVNTSSLPAGTYMLMLQGSNNASLKFVKG